MNPMSTAGGLMFLVAGIAVFVAGLLLMSWRERRRSGLKQSVRHFRRTRRALHKIFHAAETDRQVSRARARHEHPSGRPAQPAQRKAPRRRPA
ncbi:MAG TPA: hypothetical protein VM840_09890 [Actinomycetota bacterium]|nr:hypothetical protein [Actinomycetota bacterium]